MKAPNPVTAERQDPCLFQDLPAATHQVKRSLYHTPSALLSALCSDCFKILLLNHIPIPQFRRSPFTCFFVSVFQRNRNKIYNCLNFETKVCRSSRIIENTILHFGKMVLQLFSFYSCKFLLIAMKQ